MKRNTLRDKIYLAALLHDIGKFYQRADSEGVTKSKLLSESVKNSEPVFCPEFKGNYSHKHVLWTAQFIEDLGTHLKKISGETEFSLEHLAAKHHKPSNFYEEIIQLADHLSSGLDRLEGKFYQDESKSWDSFKKVRMFSVFENLMKSDLHGNHYHLPVDSLELNENFFPVQQFNDDPDYQTLWSRFFQEIKFVQTNSYKAFAETLFALLYKYTGNIASSTINLPDVSLFDHLKTTAALAVCLFDLSVSQKFSSTNEIRSFEKPFLLIGGDVSGIQSYIYDILSKKAASNLKGRSFYVQLLVDTIIQKLINKLDLFSANVIYSSGGGFYLLAPNTSETKNLIEKTIEEVTEKILNKHGTNLFLAIETEEISICSITGKNIHNNWKNLTEKLNFKKRQRFKNKLVDKYDYFFEPSGEGAELERDAFTGEEFLTNEDRIFYKDDDFGELVIKPYTKQQIRLGQLLKRADYWISADEPIPFIDGRFEVEICELGIHNYFLPETELMVYKSKIRDFKEKVRILNINNLNFLDPGKGVNNIFGFNLYGGNDYPATNDGTPLGFDKLAGEGDLKHLSYLRMDVDNLGAVFARGFTDEKRTFSRYSALSRSLDFFFKGYINTLWEQDKYNKSTFVIYSGGDDLFLVGKWDVLIEMAEEIRQRFKAWTCNNPHLTISGGVAVVDEKFPVLKASKMAGEAEDRAKEHDVYGLELNSKNAFTVLGMPLNWDIEYFWVKNLKNTLLNYFKENRLPRSFASKLHSHFANAKIENHKITHLNVLWLMAYDFSRLAGSVKHADGEVKTCIHEIKNWIFINKHPELENTKYHVFELINLATRWAELELRTNK